MDYEERRRRAPTLADFRFMERRMERFDPNRIASLAIRDQARLVNSLRSLIEKTVPEEHRAALWRQISGLIANEIIIAKNQTRAALPEMNTSAARRRFKEKGDQSKQITQRIAREKRGPNGEALTHREILKHVQAERKRLGLTPLGSPRKGREENGNSALKAIERHLNDLSY